ncbi:MAG: NAD(P)/FAD-dependent oxidoreductase [Bacteroidetes bacterium]|nr:NAD(P)/FAD-dependent oxidoreductase [Bacteroidota bacterium]
MKETTTLIIGASISGLACAATLKKKNIEFLLIEKSAQVATPWRNHYERLHLHTSKHFSNLPYKKFDGSIPKYPSRQQLVAYLEDYQKTFDIHPIFNTEAISVYRQNEYWITETNNEIYKSRFLIMCTGPYGTPRKVSIKGMETFPGKILHSSEYKTGKDFSGERVLVIGFGNSACEIAIDLVEQGAIPFMSVRSAVNVIPKEVFGISVLQLSIYMSKLPPRFADAINAPLIRLLVGNINKSGLRKKPYGPFVEINNYQSVPLIDIGTISHIKKGNIKILGEIDHITNESVYFKNGTVQEFGAIVAGIGYDKNFSIFKGVDDARFKDLDLSTRKQQYFGKEGLYFCGFWISPTGAIREISLDAQKIAGDIAGKL